MIKLKVLYQENQAEITFPCSERELSGMLRNELQCDPLDTTLLVAEVEYPKELAVYENRYVNLDVLNYLAKRLDSFDTHEETKFYEVMQHTNLTSLRDLINLSFNLQKYALITDLSDMGKVGRAYLLETEGGIPAGDLNNPKYAEIGRKVLALGNGLFTEHGLLVTDQNRKFEEVYNGKTFPPYLYDQCLFVGVLHCSGYEEYVYLPDEDIAITKAVQRLPEDGSGVTMEIMSEDNALTKVATRLLETQGLHDVNRFAAEIMECTNLQDIEKLSAVIEYTGRTDPQSVVTLAENLSRFTVTKGIENYADLGRHYLELNDTWLPYDVEEYFDYAAYGKGIAESNAGQFLSNGSYVELIEGYRIEELLEPEEDESMTMGGM